MIKPKSAILCAVLTLALPLAACAGEGGADENFRAGKEAFAANRFVDAKRALAAGLAHDPDAMDMLLMLAQTKLRLGDSEGAIAALKALPADIQQGEEVRMLRAEALMLGRKYKEAVAGLDGLTGSHADYIRALSALGQGDLPTARTAFERGAETSPVDPRLLAEYGLFELRQGDLTRAMQFVERANRAAPIELSVLLAMGELAINDSRINDAVSAYGKAVDLYPDSIVSRVAFADALGAAGRMDEAEAVVRAAVGEAKATGDAAFILAKIAAQRGDWQKVRELMQPLSGKGLPDQRVLYARSLQELGLNNLAIAEIEPIAKSLPSSHRAFVVLSSAYRAEGDSVNAAKYQRIVDGSRTASNVIGDTGYAALSNAGGR